MIVAGGGEVGVETSDLIMEKYKVTAISIVEMLDDIGPDMNPMDKALLFGNLSIFPNHFKNGLKIMTVTKIREFTDTGVSVMDKQFHEYEIEADTVVLAMGYSSNNKLFDELKDRYPEVYLVGDAGHVRKIVDAVYQANYFAREI
ncbi:MAG: NAD(P)/FAD-dependent oxidoreductase [Treponema sp.]|nr:NAD(P)/FAD-dependent oxidoreductase [Treponema sp.]